MWKTTQAVTADFALHCASPIVCDQLCNVASGDAGANDLYVTLQNLLLDWLADRSQQRDVALATSARSFLVCRMLVDDLSALQQAELSSAKLQQSQVLLQYQSLQQQAEKVTSCDLDAGAECPCIAS